MTNQAEYSEGDPGEEAEPMQAQEVRLANGVPGSGRALLTLYPSSMLSKSDWWARIPVSSIMDVRQLALSGNRS